VVERRPTWGYWIFNEGGRRWTVIKHLPYDRYISFTCFSYRVNGVVYKNDSAEFQNAVDKEIVWDKLHD